jgi:hypothetical protein
MFTQHKPSFDDAYDAAASAASGPDAQTPADVGNAPGSDAARKSRWPSASVPSSRGSRGWWLLGMVLLLAEALALGTYWIQSRHSAALLEGLGTLRAAARAGYSSQQGYGLVPGATVRLGPSARVNGGWPVSEAQMRSRVSTFSLSLDGVSPLVCAQVLPYIDTGWSELRYNGEVLSLPVSSESARAACGYWRSGQLELLSSG